ncbi:Tetratricopeptide repeat protein SKI3 [Abeliophyllum distichum]|uniref:Adaptor AP-1 19 kDa protein n=1 Tax=Abeliophyllum distichum TaxID=126358 RepID=A0ABD1T0D5_9LAMI
MIHFVLLISRQGKVRLTKWYSPYSQKERTKVIRELSGMILTRGPKLCNFVEWRGYKVVYKRYASLYFCMCIDQEDNELEVLEIIHHFVEILDRYFGSVCELDLIFNFHKAYYILDEILIAGELQETSKKTVARLIAAQDSLVEQAKEQASTIKIRTEPAVSVVCNTQAAGGRNHGPGRRRRCYCKAIARINRFRPLMTHLSVLIWEFCYGKRGRNGRNAREKAVEHLADPQRALKCYQRAITLNPDDSEAGEAICDLLDQGGKESLEVSVCKEASEKSARAFWAFRRLGYLQAHQGKWSEAVQSLQHAIRGFPTCADLWEALGLAYQRMGMFTAALKSYGRAVELENSRVFALIESGNISLMLGSFRKGVEQFQEALKISPLNVSAHYGLGSAFLGLAKECINSGAFRWGASLLEEASKVATDGTKLSGNISCLWKLHGDIQLMYARCFPWMEEFKLAETDEKAFRSSISSWKRTRCLAATSASRSYQRALHLAPWQANIYADTAIASDLNFSLKEDPDEDVNAWSLAEKMCLGGLLLEGHNDEFWVALGCLSKHTGLKQHALIRGLQLDVSLAVAWAYLGKLYRQEGEKQLAQQAFDRARSIEPSLALPWAGMSADADFRKLKPDEAYECCLLAVQIFPLAEFQIGLAKLALHSGYLPSSEVFGAIRHALQRAPHYPESHNLNGLVCESRGDYQSAITSYRLARCAIRSFAGEVSESFLKDISINLARSLCRAGNVSDAVEECESLKQKGLLDTEGLHVYALCLWRLGKNDMALSVTRTLAAGILSMEQKFAAASVSLICRLLYYISGQESSIISILKMPKELFQNSKISFVVSAIHVLDQNDRLESVVSSSRSSLTSHEEITAMHMLIAVGKLVKHGSKDCLAIQTGVDHLRKALHKYPNSSVLRNLLGYILLSSKEQRDLYLSTRCSFIDLSDHQKEEGIKSACEIVGAWNSCLLFHWNLQWEILLPHLQTPVAFWIWSHPTAAKEFASRAVEP